MPELMAYTLADTRDLVKLLFWFQSRAWEEKRYDQARIIVGIISRISKAASQLERSKK